tara:strand:- start:228 stop:572 length:345 start_codon:yes stop_codon:yes gene_type:complete
MSYYKYDEIKDRFLDFISEQSDDWIHDNYEELHHHAFNTDYYIIGTYKATQWLGDHVFDCINIIKEYEQDNFGQVTTDLSNPEKVVNMYTYIVGEQVVFDWLSLRLKFTKAVND